MSREQYLSSENIDRMVMGDKNFSAYPAVAGRTHTDRSISQLSSESLQKSNGISVPRSRSFTGGLNKPTSVLGDHVKTPGVQKKSTYQGQTNPSGGSFKRMPKMPKVPRPQRAGIVFEALTKGLRECVLATDEDLRLLHNRSEETAMSTTAQAKMYDLEKQLKSAERYKKRLEFHLTKIDEMCDCYVLQHQLREGARNMAKAYVASPNSKRTLLKVKDGYKECTQNMCAIEAQLENMMGTFHCRMKGMVGFARLMPGDVFEITIRHGEQKWKSKGRINKNGQQKWDNPVMVYKALLSHVFTIKAVESRTLSRNISLGERHCETKDLFSANPQMMTVNVNSAGSLKLSVIVTWNPLEGIDDKLMYYDPTPHLEKGRFGSTLSLTQPLSQSMVNLSPSSSSSLSPFPGASMFSDELYPKRHLGNGHAYQFDGRPKSAMYLPDASSSGSGSRSPSLQSNRYSMPAQQVGGYNTHNDNSRPLTTHTSSISSNSSYEQTDGMPSSGRCGSIGSEECTMHFDTVDSGLTSEYSRQNSASNGGHESEMNHASISTTAGMSKQKLLDMRMLTESLEEHGNCGSGNNDISNTLGEALVSLRSLLQDYREHYTELRYLGEQINVLAEMAKKNAHGRLSRSSSISVSIESALEAFDFLNTEGDDSDVESPRHEPKQKQIMLTAKTSDSGIESLANHLLEDMSPGDSRQITTGNEQVDQCLIHHLAYCERLLQNLGGFGPLKCKEIYALDKLEKEGLTIERLLLIARVGNQGGQLDEVLQDLTPHKRLREFWVKCVDQTTLYVNSERFVAQLERSYGERIRDQYDIVASRVFKKVAARILDIPSFESDNVKTTTIITLHQFMSFFNDEGMKTVTEYVEHVAKQIWTSNRLRSGDSDMVVKTIFTFRDSLPHTDCLKVLSLLLISNNREIKHTAASYLRGLNVTPDLRNKALVVYVEALEDRNADIRCGACVALAALKGKEAMDQLVFVSQSDTSHVVKASAKEALFSFGSEGRHVYEQAVPPISGYPGFSMQKR